jgi:alkylation response protein AidB-like acyl-CoA dehydrogenase
LDFSLTKEQTAFRDSVRDFARQELNPGANERDRGGHFPAEAWKKCADFGIFGLPLPAEYGGTNRNMLEVILAMEALGYGCEDNGLLFAMGAQIWSMQMPILIFGTAEQKKQWLPRFITGESIGAHAVSEAEAGSDIFSLRTKAKRNGSSWLLNGQKSWTTNAPVADVLLVMATVDASLGDKGLTTFLIEKGTPGLTINGPLEKMGMRTAMMGELVLRDCPASDEDLLGKMGSGSAIFNSSMEWERAFILAPAVGAMQRELERCIQFARRRHQFGKPIGNYQSVSNKLVEMHMRVETSRLLLYRGAWMKSQRKRLTSEPSETKLHISESWVQNCLDAMQIHGARGYMVDSGLEKQLRDALASRIYSGTSEIQKVILAAYLGL